ncbi:uncharacterized protein [Choristoneura fumiferana]|uniref:uncharacterized protein n=1 Tax=Choristoneura fumiferana TaxID=7141 RepID=UPI003D15CF3B
MTLTELSIHSERLVKLENDFSHFDDTLQRLSLKKISMTTDQFMSFRNVVNLSLIETGLEEIPDLSLFSRLEYLSVREGRLLDARRLAAAPALRALVLEAPDAALAAVPRLKRATFINAYATDRIFGNCSELESLSVERGSLNALRAGWLAGCARLRRLDLHDNLLEALPDSLLTDAVALTYLDLSHNMLRALPSDLLKRSKTLTHLNVSHNLLTAVPNDLFVHTRQLLRLDLNHNRLTAVPSTLPNGPFELKRLDLSHNQLTDLPESFWFPVTAIASDLNLDLSHNKLSQLLNVSSTEMKLFKGINLSHQL